jgi:AcrR family transcriptional regulator
MPLLNEASIERSEQRRRVILDSARECFLKFGYSKTSLEDIANQAGISRPLLYKKFKGKTEIFAAVLEDILTKRYPAIEETLAMPLNNREKLFRIYKALILDPWDQLMEAPMAREFNETCRRTMPEIEAKHKRKELRYTQTVLKSKQVAEIFMLAANGLIRDLPSTTVLKIRLELLIEQFVPE